MIKAQPGTYALVFASSTAAAIRVGKLGSLRLQPGFHVYVGSAHGPGGLRARLAHHSEPSTHPHWHVDYLKAHANLEEVWYCLDHRQWEHEWAQRVGMQSGASAPLAGFGASDCLCETHLFFFESRPSRTAFARSLRAFGCNHSPVLLYRMKQ
jgi:Uri superfamily endonuclease